MDERSLVDAARRGDVPAFNQLVLGYQTMAYNVAFRILGNSAAAEDATQEAFLAAYRSIGGLRGGAFKPWLLRIVTNKCLDQVRADKRRPIYSIDALPAEPDRLIYTADRSELPDEAVERQMLAAAVQEALLTLSPEHRTILVLADVHSLSYGDVGAVLGISLGTVRSRLSRARARLRNRLLAHQDLLPEWAHQEGCALPQQAPA